MTKVFRACTIISTGRKDIMVKFEIALFYDTSDNMLGEVFIDEIELISFYDINKKEYFTPSKKDIPLIRSLTYERIELEDYEKEEEYD